MKSKYRGLCWKCLGFKPSRHNTVLPISKYPLARSLFETREFGGCAPRFEEKLQFEISFTLPEKYRLSFYTSEMWNKEAGGIRDSLLWWLIKLHQKQSLSRNKSSLNRQLQSSSVQRRLGSWEFDQAGVYQTRAEVEESKLQWTVSGLSETRRTYRRYILCSRYILCPLYSGTSD